jgi:membrane protein
MRRKIKNVWQILQDAADGFLRHKVQQLSASLAFYTVFSLGPIILVVIFFSNLFWGRQAIEGSIYQQIRGIVGNETAIQIQEIIKNTAIEGNNMAAVIGFVTLIIAATTVFIEMQDSINTIWDLRLKKLKSAGSWKKMLQNRLLSFSFVTGLGFLLLVSLIIDGLLESFMNRLQRMFPGVAIEMIYIFNTLLTFMVVTLLFAFIYKYLPDAIIHWKEVMVGALFTAAMFMLGKYGITFYLGHSKISSAYGSAGSLVILLLWVYYSSIILYFGAEITKAYALRHGIHIKPTRYAVSIKYDPDDE